VLACAAVKTLLLLPLLLSGTPAPAPPPVPKPPDLVVLYEHADFAGKVLGLPGDALNLVPLGFNDVASSFKVRRGYRATFFEDTGAHGEWFTFNCPSVPIGIPEGDYCELKNVGNDIATGALCQFRGRDAPGCVGWWNDRISGVGRIGPADESRPQGRIDQGHTG
jgi:hypothetical protein